MNERISEKFTILKVENLFWKLFLFLVFFEKWCFYTNFWKIFTQKNLNWRPMMTPRSHESMEMYIRHMVIRNRLSRNESIVSNTIREKCSSIIMDLLGGFKKMYSSYTTLFVMVENGTLHIFSVPLKIF